MYANDGITVNTKYKDRLFRFIFGAEENKKYLLSLYNAVNGTEYENVEDIEITTLEDVIYIKMKNDISFIFDSEMTLYEHQGSYNPNMPLRGRCILQIYTGNGFQDKRKTCMGVR